MRVTRLVKGVALRLVALQNPPLGKQLQLMLLQVAVSKFDVGTAFPWMIPPLTEKL